MAPQKITSWSYSRYQTYVQCPLKAKLQYIDKLKDPGNAAMERGNQIHKLAEAYLKGQLKKLPPALGQFGDDFKEDQKRVARLSLRTCVEESWTLTKDWAQTVWNDWQGAWLRLKLDFAFETDGDAMVIKDWKTGKFREADLAKYVEQLELYALVALLLHKHIKVVRPYLIYLDQGRVFPDPDLGDKPLTFTQADVPRLKKEWLRRTKPMLSDTQFAPRPNAFCYSCHFRASNKANGGGQCRF